jgi:hypothetical protein
MLGPDRMVWYRSDGVRVDLARSIETGYAIGDGPMVLVPKKSKPTAHSNNP